MRQPSGGITTTSLQRVERCDDPARPSKLWALIPPEDVERVLNYVNPPEGILWRNSFTRITPDIL